MEPKSQEKPFMQRKQIPRFPENEKSKSEQQPETIESLRDFTKRKFTEKAFYDKLKPSLEHLLDKVLKILLIFSEIKNTTAMARRSGKILERSMSC